MVSNGEVRELYALLVPVLDGYNRTHDVQVSSLDFTLKLPDAPAYDGALVCREYEDNLISENYRELMPDDFDWFTAEDWDSGLVEREQARIAQENRRASQAAHRQGRNLSTLWFNKMD